MMLTSMLRGDSWRWVLFLADHRHWQQFALVVGAGRLTLPIERLQALGLHTGVGGTRAMSLVT